MAMIFIVAMLITMIMVAYRYPSRKRATWAPYRWAARVARGRSSWPQVGGDNDDHDDEKDDDGEPDI